jgi:2-(1,2-epoxy-1,2-dihydrophenyl)acetyl-CoA isomerase
MNDKPVIVTVEEGIAEFRLNRPKVLNAVSREMLALLREAVAEIAARGDVGVCTITGDGRAFCAGADLTDPMMGNELPREQRGDNCAKVMDTEINAMLRDFRALRLPKLAVVNGITAGGGVGLALVADIVIAARSASFLVPFVPKLGIIPDLGATWHLPRLLGRARAIGVAMLGDPVTAEQAEAWGLIWKCVDDDKLVEEARSIATRLRDGPRRAQVELSDLIDQGFVNSFSDHLDAERDVQRVVCQTDDVEEAMAAFKEKRPPRFKGR